MPSIAQRTSIDVENYEPVSGSKPAAPAVFSTGYSISPGAYRTANVPAALLMHQDQERQFVQSGAPQYRLYNFFLNTRVG